MKKLFFMVMAVVSASFVCVNVNAEELVFTDVSNASEFNTAIAKGENIKLLDDVTVGSSVTIDKDITLDLNGYDVSATNKVFIVNGGEFTVIGKGEIKESTPDYAPIMVKGSTDANATNYSVVNIGKDVTLTGWAGVFVEPTSKTDSNGFNAYGVVVNMNGTINSVNDSSDGVGIGIYVNGYVKDKVNYPVINVGETAKITTTGNGFYLAGYAQLNISGGDFTAVESVIGFKAGIVNINDGKFVVTGDDTTPPGTNNDGINASGAVIHLESNVGYPGDMVLNINGGTFESQNGAAIYEFLADKTDASQVKSINIGGGEFKGYIHTYSIPTRDVYNAISVNSENGNVTFEVDGESVISALAGETVKVIPSANAGYVFSKIVVTNSENGNVIPVNGTSFVMPNNAIDVNVEYVAVPGVPTNVKAVSAGHNKVNVSWKAVEGADGYQVYKYNSTTKAYDKLIYTGSALAVNTVYGNVTGQNSYYKVRAYKVVNGKKVYGEFATRVYAKPIPATPLNVKATKYRSGVAKLSWSKVEGATGYAIYKYNSSTKKYVLIKRTTALATTTSYGLKSGSGAYYKVSAYKTVNGVRVYGALSASKYVRV